MPTRLVSEITFQKNLYQMIVDESEIVTYWLVIKMNRQTILRYIPEPSNHHWIGIYKGKVVKIPININGFHTTLRHVAFFYTIEMHNIDAKFTNTIS